MKPVLLLDIVGMTPAQLRHMPSVAALGARGARAELGTVLPAVTCSAQSTFLTGRMPAEHGIVGNGWYFGDLGEIHLWRQHNKLVAGEKLWESARAVRPDYRAANLCWWYAMGASTDLAVTPRPVYHADGRKSPDCYTRPPSLHDELTERFGPFPLFHYWGPTASLRSTRWIVGAARHVLAHHRPDLQLVYVPHLDYDLQRFGPDSPEAVAAARDVDVELAPLLREAEEAGVTVVALSEYGITPVQRPVDINRALRAEGLLEVYTQEGMEYLDPWASRAFAVADHQVAHVHVADESDQPKVRDLVRALGGVDEVLDRSAQQRYGLDHHRAGDFVAVAEPDAWFTYYYWLDEDRAPDFARGVEIHRKPGFDPAELFFDPADRWAKVRALTGLARKRVGLRYAMNVVPTDPRWVRGSHGRLPDSAEHGPVLLSTDPFPDGIVGPGDRIPATRVRDLVLGLQGLTGQASRKRSTE
ncbi:MULTISPECIES: alkaline phosphatase family protein [unclassified Saccharopolyspora]|uniref:alkaline phosphatase family protein n=1 Tax=unclassified Saccharopolyspora TaxID=2646250 RepID=UPI001CD1CB9E|nr:MULTISPECIES: nucleotide pyrophosphatase/phosphodiesterase family protein [unclassified Saccharopolyspora]MCA1185154.1 alkaline phosphatase family protein [Saccharopolyspora sp. 6T]MCA1191370.1 alkaline phosphatase family protein [Saccharopolyspora sp. 6V]MCA1278480.1 alkaline phosphatase family protein [Saccharopolyspora sp. 7B]